MSDERVDRVRRFNEICKSEQDPIDPCIPIQPISLNRRKGDPCDGVDGEVLPESCVFNLRNPSPDPVTPAAVRGNAVYRNVEIQRSCDQMFGLLPAIDGDVVNVIIEAGEFTSSRSQADADAQAEAIVLSRIQCRWGNNLTTVTCLDKFDNPNDEGGVTLEIDTTSAKFNARDFPSLRFNEQGNAEFAAAAQTLKEQANDAAFTAAMNSLNCVWVNTLLSLECHQKLENVVPVTVPEVDGDGELTGNTTIWYVTSDSNEKVSDGVVIIPTGTTQTPAVDSEQTTIASSSSSLTQNFVVNYDGNYKGAAEDEALAQATAELQCFYENIKMTINCCEAFDPNNQDKTLSSDPDHIRFYYDNYVASGNPPFPRDAEDDKGLPSSIPDIRIFPENQSLDTHTPAIGRNEENPHPMEPWITANFTVQVAVVTEFGEEVSPEEQSEIFRLNCGGLPDSQNPLEIETEIIPIDIFRTIDGLTNRCNNTFIDAEYRTTNNPVTIETATVITEERGEAFLGAVNIATATLVCRWSNDEIAGDLCPDDLNGNPVDPRSIGSVNNPARAIAANIFLSDISKADANATAKASNVADLDCFYSNDAFDMRCLGCQLDQTAVVNQISTVTHPAFYYRVSNALHLLNDHCGNRLENNMVEYYELYEAEYQNRRVFSPNPAALPSIDTFLLTLDETDSIFNPVNGITYPVPAGLDTIAPIPSGNQADYYYDELPGMNQGSCPAGGAASQGLVEAGTYTSKTSKNEANGKAEADAFSQFQCVFGSDLIDVRCEGCLPVDAGYGFVAISSPASNFQLYNPDPDYVASNALVVQQDCIQQVPGKVASGFADIWDTVEEEFITNREDNICNYAEDAVVRVVVKSNSISSALSQADANAQAEAQALSLLQCRWDNPEVNRYCFFGPYNQDGGTTCDPTPDPEFNDYLPSALTAVTRSAKVRSSTLSLNLLIVDAQDDLDNQLRCDLPGT